MKGNPQLAWQLNNQIKCKQLLDRILCRRFEKRDIEAIFQQTVPPSMTHKVSSTCHSSTNAGHLGVAKTTEKIKQRLYWLGLQEDTKLFVSQCPECQKRSGTLKKNHHSLMEWQVSYDFHHFGIHFMGHLPLSYGIKHIFFFGDYFIEWYGSIPLPEQKAVTFEDALVDH